MIGSFGFIKYMILLVTCSLYKGDIFEEECCL